jgi:hypothetical protein
MIKACVPSSVIRIGDTRYAVEFRDEGSSAGEVRGPGGVGTADGSQEGRGGGTAVRRFKRVG